MTARKDGICFLYLCVAKKVLKNIAHNGLAMKSSGIETLNYRMRTNLNRIINLTVSTKPAIFYSRCYAPFLFQKYGSRS